MTGWVVAAEAASGTARAAAPTKAQSTFLIYLSSLSQATAGVVPGCSPQAFREPISEAPGDARPKCVMALEKARIRPYSVVYRDKRDSEDRGASRVTSGDGSLWARRGIS